MAFGETYSALETGLVDGAENNLPTYFTSLHYKVAGFYTLTRHARIPEIVVGSAASFAALSEADRELIAKAADDVVDFQRRAWREYESQSAQRIILLGVTLVTPGDLGPWKKLAAAVYDRQPPEIRDYVARIKAVK
jgi:TRAP-type C4-dicarboxylate transport system substrate-binding protein